MKYLKGTFALFVCTLCLGLVGVSAREYAQLLDIKIPAWGGSFISKQVDKDNDWTYTQKVKKRKLKMILLEMVAQLVERSKECSLEWEQPNGKIFR